MAVRTIEIGSGAVDRRKWMYTDSEMSFFGRENLRNSAFQRGKSFFYSFVQKELLCSLWRGRKVKVCPHETQLPSPVGSGIWNPPVVDRQNSQTYSIQEFNAFRFNVRLKERFTSTFSRISPVDSWRYLEFVAVKTFPKELGNDGDHNNKRTARWILFPFGKITTMVFTHSFRVKYAVCSRTKVVLNFIEFLPSTVWRSFHSLAAKKKLRRTINNVCVSTYCRL